MAKGETIAIGHTDVGRRRFTAAMKTGSHEGCNAGQMDPSFCPRHLSIFLSIYVAIFFTSAKTSLGINSYKTFASVTIRAAVACCVLATVMEWISL